MNSVGQAIVIMSITYIAYMVTLIWLELRRK